MALEVSFSRRATSTEPTSQQRLGSRHRPAIGSELVWKSVLFSTAKGNWEGAGEEAAVVSSRKSNSNDLTTVSPLPARNRVRMSSSQRGSSWPEALSRAFVRRGRLRERGSHRCICLRPLLPALTVSSGVEAEAAHQATRRLRPMTPVVLVRDPASE
eukprot:CAMPEP_0173194726 /NCGR_PEP_ID=MMETSP1141-20130122/14664_1 /TAXON_ID=483371 /ORGANISM="non described non described, Strain CCMP2298" /LENGTH=156 /DNA_ID=CAMNT_0014119185 /DNA_START=362 /DNA_END=832 /DNA_ORIENTATION=+